MSENKNIQNEEELWDLLSEPVSAEPKAAKPAKSEPRFAKPEPKPVPAPEVKAEPAPAVKAEAPKSGNKIDSFFLACMAGVAAVSVAVTLVVGSMFGGDTPNPSVKDPVSTGDSDGLISKSPDLEAEIEALELENAELRAQLEQQKEQIKDLQNDLITLMGSEEYLATASTDPDGSNEELSAQMAALETFAQIQEAYADFDRAKLEELIPQMDAQLSYLTPEALNNYYLILEYVEQPSNG